MPDTTPDIDPKADQFVDGLLARLHGSTDPKVLRLARLMAYTAGYRDAVHDQVEKLAAKVRAA